VLKIGYDLDKARALASAADITGAPRGSRIDIGAYQYRQGE
jgi:hypothetical protein